MAAPSLVTQLPELVDIRFVPGNEVRFTGIYGTAAAPVAIPAGATLTGQIRPKAGSSRLLAELTVTADADQGANVGLYEILLDEAGSADVLGVAVWDVESTPSGGSGVETVVAGKMIPSGSVVAAYSAPVAGLELLPGNYDIVIYRGDSFDFVATVQEGDPLAAVNLTGATCTSTVKKSASSLVSSAIIEATVFPDQVGDIGKVQIVGRDDQTSDLNGGDYVWDLQVRHAPNALYPEGRVRTYLGGAVTIIEDVSRP